MELKVIADATTGIFTLLEIQRGKDPKRNPNIIADTLRPTAACTKRMAKHTKKKV